jgi:hypothetical protein
VKRPANHLYPARTDSQNHAERSVGDSPGAEFQPGFLFSFSEMLRLLIQQAQLSFRTMGFVFSFSTDLLSMISRLIVFSAIS